MNKARPKKAVTERRSKIKKGTLKKASKSKQSAKVATGDNSVRLGLYGLGEILRAVHEGGGDLLKNFEQTMGSSNLTVRMDVTTARKLKIFAAQKLAGHPIARQLTDFPKPNLAAHFLSHAFASNNCDPGDKWCIGWNHLDI